MGDMDTLRSLPASDVTWHTPRQGAGEFHGIDDVIAKLGRLPQVSDGIFRVSVNELTKGDQSVVVLTHPTGTRAGKALDQDHAHIFRFNGDQISESCVIGYDQEASAGFRE